MRNKKAVKYIEHTLRHKKKGGSKVRKKALEFKFKFILKLFKALETKFNLNLLKL